ncbi:ethanolamine ammonia-lyase reactivating factor EutA [Natronorarus salvus]|uniref:ethanolamine ammonia-lyase reactivating factor EutA n=1 Tax=Natronorarus salvus TaxID=3117733 RepID=UPI002F265FBB
MADRTETITSVGVDVGTTTTQTVVSRLRVEVSPYDGAASPRITDREIVFRGPIHETPLLDPETVDIEGVLALVESDLAEAGVSPEGIDTGAVIVTGETARKENAEPLAHRLAADSGTFVSAVAGASLEAVLAARGSGAAAYAARTGETVANVDVGGGTTNAAIFEGGGLRETRCLDVGGRLLRFDSSEIVTGVSEPVRRLAESQGIALSVGEPIDEGERRVLADAMADRLADLLSGPPFEEQSRELAIEDLPTESVEIDALAFTGGVGRLVRTPLEDPLSYGDLGSDLARAIRDHPVISGWRHLDIPEDIRATVIGAGTETTTFSGRTVAVDPAHLPLRNVPVVSVGDLSEYEGESELRAAFEETVERATALYDLVDLDALALSIEDIGVLGYDRIRDVGAAFADARSELPSDLVPVVVTRQNCAKALAGAVRGADGCERTLLAIDELRVGEGDYLDVGEPFRGGEAVPVVVKTLAFDEASEGNG